MREESIEQRPAEESIPEGARAAEEQNSSGMVAGGPPGEPAQGVLTLVCFTCGKEYFFADQNPPEEITCEKCGNTVFRSFFTPINDEVADDFRDSTERDMTPDSTATDTTASDIIDLNNF
ncbi:hypothetical protein BH24GEM3_BH24GEM3_14670 [soil metagenome]|jgi:ribosomal protein S27AE|nr:hypothetical protein [Gemmatimonadota bacterium]